MIIKKNKKSDSINQDTKVNQETQTPGLQENDTAFPVVRERQERRRGDRRRGYRRIDDRNLISRAHEEANAIKEIAAKEGYEHGLNQARNELKKLGYTISEFLQAKELAMKEAANDIAFIAIKVAEKIIRTEVSCDETIVLSIISDVLKEISKDETSIIIKTNSVDTQIVQENLPKIFPYGNANAKIVVVSDDNVEWGSCIVETSSGMIDARFSTQLQILKKAFEAGL